MVMVCSLFKKHDRSVEWAPKGNSLSSVSDCDPEGGRVAINVALT